MPSFHTTEFLLGLLTGTFVSGLMYQFIGWSFIKVWFGWLAFFGGLAFLSGLLFVCGMLLAIEYGPLAKW